MSENVSFIQGSKENYNPSEMAGGVFFSKDTKEILLNGESYGNSVKADEEDITLEEGNLKLKDRSYDEANFSGKGYVILRKNILEITVPKFDLTISSGCTTNGTITVTLGDSPTQVEVTTDASTPEAVAQLIQAAIPESTIEGVIVTFTSNPTLDYSTTGVTGSVADNSYQENRNILTLEMINNPNTVYEIRYDFDLNGLEIIVPLNCILNFTGGGLSNGIVDLNNCLLYGDSKFNILAKNFSNNIILLSKINNKYTSQSILNELSDDDSILFINKPLIWKKANNGDDIINLDNKKTLSIVGIDKEISKLTLETENVNSTREWFTSSLFGKSFNVKNVTIIRKGNLNPSANVGAVFTVPFTNGLFIKGVISKNNYFEVEPVRTIINDLFPVDEDEFVSIGNTVKFIIEDTSSAYFNSRNEVYNSVYLRYSKFVKSNKVFRDCYYDPALCIVYKDANNRLNMFNVDSSSITTKEELVKQWDYIRSVELKSKLGLVIDNTEIGFCGGRILRNPDEKISMYPYLAVAQGMYTPLGGTLESIKDTRNVGRIMTWQKTTATFNDESFEYVSLQARGAYTDIDDIPVGICINASTYLEAPVLALATGKEVTCNVALVNGTDWKVGDIIIPNNESYGVNKSLFIKTETIPEDGIYGIMIDSGSVASDSVTYNKGDIILYNNHGYTAMLDNIHTYKDWDGEESGYNALRSSMAWKETGCSAVIYRLENQMHSDWTFIE